MQHETFSWISKHGAKIFAQQWQPDGAAPRAVIALVHGLGEHSGRYAHVAQAFSQAGLALIAFDLPGHGLSEGIRGHTSFADLLDEIDHLLGEARQRHPAAPLLLYGHSLGGELVLYYTLKRRPDLKGIISTSPPLGTTAPVPVVKRLMARAIRKVAPAFTLNNGLDSNDLSRDPEVCERYRQDPLVHPRISASLGWDLLSVGPWIIERAPELSLPLLLVHGTSDRITSPPATQDFANRAPANLVTLKLWEGYYHETHNEPEKDAVIAYTIQWINHLITIQDGILASA